MSRYLLVQCKVQTQNRKALFDHICNESAISPRKKKCTLPNIPKFNVGTPTANPKIIGSQRAGQRVELQSRYIIL